MDKYQIITDAILGNGRFVSVNGTIYEIKPPTIRKIAQVMSFLSKEEISGSLAEALFSFDKISENRINGVACILGIDPSSLDGTLEEFNEVVQTWVSLVSADDFFRFATSIKSVEAIVAT